MPITESPKPNAYRSSLEVSWKEGIAAMAMIAISDYYLIPFALFMGAMPIQIGLLVAVPHLLASICQLFAVRAVYLLGSRLKFLVHATFIQAAFLLPIACLPLFRSTHRIAWMILLVVCFRIIGNLIGTVWGGLASDYLPPEERGKYFGWRSRIAGVAGVSSTLVAGIILFIFKKFWPAAGFICVFLIAATCRFISAGLMSRMQDVPVHHTKGSDFTFIQFLARFRRSNFVKFVLYVSSITFATMLASPYFSVYMLRDLKLNYLIYTAVSLASVIAQLIAFPIWGHHADVIGNARVLKLTSLLIPFIPFFWAFSTHWPVLIGIELFSGFVWGGFNLCSVNFIYDAVRPEKRVRCLSYFALINGIATCCGASLGGYLAEHLPRFTDFRLPTLFLVSAFLRMASHAFLSQKFHEVRTATKHMTSLDLFFSVVGIKTLLGGDQEWFPISLARKPTWQTQTPETEPK